MNFRDMGAFENPLVTHSNIGFNISGPPRVWGHGFVGHTLSTLHRYRAMLCTIDLCCAPPICVVHDGSESAPNFFRSRNHVTKVLIRWRPWRFFMYVIRRHLDGAQCDVVSLAAFHKKQRSSQKKCTEQSAFSL